MHLSKNNFPMDAEFDDREAIRSALKAVTDALRTLDDWLHVAQNDGSVFRFGFNMNKDW